MRTANPSIEWWKLPDTICLKFTFQGYLTTTDAERAIDEWRQAFRAHRGTRVTLVWDCLHMEGYSHKARSLWTHALAEMKSQIVSIWLITTSSIVKMGASVMALFSGLDVRIVTSEHTIRAAHTPPPAPFIHGEDREDQTGSIRL